MLILIEGLDRTGKTTLAEKLREITGAAVVHRGQPVAQDPLTEYLGPLSCYEPGSGLSLVLDRGYWDEMIYPKAYGREPFMGWPEFAYIDHAMAGLGAIAVLAEDGLERIHQRALADGEAVNDRDTIAELSDGYESIIEQTALPVVRWNLRSGPERDKIAQAAGGAEDIAAALRMGR